MTSSPSKESLNPLREPIPDLSDTEADVGDTLNGFRGTIDEDHGAHEPHGNLPTFEELLLSAEEMQKSEREGLSDEHMAGNFDDAVKRDCDRLISPTSSRGENNDRPIVLEDSHLQSCDTDSSVREASNSSVQTSNGLIAEEQDVEQDSLSTRPTSVASSESTYSTLHEKNVFPVSNTPPPRRNCLLPSTHGKQTCEPNDRGYKQIELDPSAGKHKEDQWIKKQAEAEDEEEDPNAGQNKNPAAVLTETLCQLPDK